MDITKYGTCVAEVNKMIPSLVKVNQRHQSNQHHQINQHHQNSQHHQNNRRQRPLKKVYQLKIESVAEHVRNTSEPPSSIVSSMSAPEALHGKQPFNATCLSVKIFAPDTAEQTVKRYHMKPCRMRCSGLQSNANCTQDSISPPKLSPKKKRFKS